MRLTPSLTRCRRRSMGIMPCFLTVTANQWGQRHHLHPLIIARGDQTQSRPRMTHDRVPAVHGDRWVRVCVCVWGERMEMSEVWRHETKGWKMINTQRCLERIWHWRHGKLQEDSGSWSVIFQIISVWRQRPDSTTCLLPSFLPSAPFFPCLLICCLVAHLCACNWRIAF